MKKKFVLIVTAALLITCVHLMIAKDAFSPKGNVKHNLKSNNQSVNNPDNNEPKIAELKNGGRVDAIYLDSCNTLKELKENSDIIITGYVGNQNEFSSLSTISIIKVEQVYKGNKLDTIEVLQLKGNNVLKPDSHYVLFLGKQTNDSEKYFIKGGSQGAFLDNNGKLVNTDKKMIKEIEKIKNNIEASTITQLDGSSNAANNEYDTLISFLEENNL